MLLHRTHIRGVVLPAALTLVALFASSCATPGGGGGAGRRAPDPCRVPPAQAARDAVLSPATWVPLAAALALQLGNSDERLSDWAFHETPVFGSPSTARDMSDVFYWTTVAGYGATALAVSLSTAGDESATQAPDEGWMDADCRPALLPRLGVAFAAHAATGGATELLKKGINRTRPDGSNSASMPSAHTSGSAATATLAARSLDWTPLSHRSAGIVRGGLALTTAATAWARIEGGRHYPSDVLVGAALGHLIGAIASDALLGRGADGDVVTELTLWHSADSSTVCVRWSF